MTIRVELVGRRELVREVRRRGKKGLMGLARGLTKEAEGVMRLSKREVPVDQGVLRSSGFVRKPRQVPRGMEITMGYGGAAKAYALAVHEGTGPAVGRPAFRPPVKPFAEWAKRVLGDESLGFVVARAVGQRGLTPSKYLERPLRKRIRGMAARLAKHVRNDMGGR